MQLVDRHLHGSLIHFGVHGWAAGELLCASGWAGQAGRAGKPRQVAGATGALQGAGICASSQGLGGAKAAERTQSQASAPDLKESDSRGVTLCVTNSTAASPIQTRRYFGSCFFI